MPTPQFHYELLLPLQQQLQDKPSQPQYLILYRAFQQSILQGQLPAGTKLPSSRQLSQNLAISRNTVKTVYEMLQAEGYIEARHGSGSYISSHLPERTPPVAPTSTTSKSHVKTVTLSRVGQRLQQQQHYTPAKGSDLLAVAQPDMRLFPWQKWQRSFSKANARLKHNQERSAMGCYELREQIANYLKITRGVKCDAEQVMICSGSQQGMFLSLQMLVNPNDPVLVEEPGYSGIDGALAAMGAQKIAVAADHDGFKLEQGLLQSPNAQIAILTPSRNFPMGYTLSLERRLELIEWAGKTAGWLIEDDYDSELRFDDVPLTALQGLGGEHCVIYTGTFSRILHHSLRLGYLVIPPTLVDSFAKARRFIDGGMSLLPQLALAEFMASGNFAGHVRRMRKIYQQRQQTLHQLIEQQLNDKLRPLNKNGSMHSVYALPANIDDQVFCQQANRSGLGIRPLSRYYTSAASLQGLAMGFAGYDEDELTIGVTQLRQLLYMYSE